MTKTSTSITRQLQWVFAVSIVILLISSAASYLSNNKLIEASKWVNHTNEVIKESDNLMAIVREAEANQRGYILTNNIAFLKEYNGSHTKAINSYTRLKNLSGDNTAQQKNLAAEKVLVETRFRQMQKVVDIAMNIPYESRSQLFINNRDIQEGKSIMDELKAVGQKVKNEELKLLETRTRTQELYTQYTPILVIIAAILAIGISILSYLRIKKDLEERVRKQKEEEAKYIETSNRINIIETVTQKLAQGDFTARSADEGEDELNKISVALNSMAASLQDNFQKLEKINQLQSGAVHLNTAMRGERFIKNVSTKILDSVAAYLKAPMAALYTLEQNEDLKLTGSYGAANAPEYIPANHGLTGQAVLSKQLLIVDNVPEHYTKITSSLGSALPATLLILPLLYGKEVIGVMEIGLLNNPGDLALQFLTENAEAMGIGLNGAVNYEKMQNLLEETQAQSEELQVQHNEMENINTELEAQAEKLQASEEELKVQQEELQQANVELEERSRLLEESYQKISEQNIEVTRKADELALTTKYKSEFLANMSHELRTPLNSILLLSRLLAENTETNLNDDQVEYARVILNSGNGLLSLIDEILDLSKIEAGKMLLEFEQVPLQEIVTDIHSLFAPVAEDKKLEFDITSSDHSLGETIETDKMRLEQVLKNLVSNALKFTTRGGVSIDIYKDRNTSGYICFSVKDTGIGIAENKQKLIFEAFQQADGSTRRKYGGTGLGLSISKELIKLLGGDIFLKSAHMEGSTFTICIPVSQNKEAQQNEAIEITVAEPMKLQQVLPETGGGEKYLSQHIPEGIPDDRAITASGDKSILIIEDDINFARSLLDYTRNNGYRGIVAVRGDEGIELARQFMPTGILLDLQLPVMSGWEVMDSLKSDPFTRHIPVHMMSSYEVKKESLLKGAIDFINKPVAFEQMQDIFKKLEYVLEKKAKQVLIVEENPKHAKALAYFLETYNISAEVKHTVDESITALNQEIDCVILDMGIPDQKSYDTLEEIKKKPAFENVPIIIFTGKNLSLPEEQRIKKYADSIVVKTAHSYQRILDEISIFLHLVEEHTKKSQPGSYKKLGMLNDVLKDKTILVVDDDVRNVFSLTKALEKLDMNVIAAVDGKEAMKKLQEHTQIDLVLLDMMMPEMDGYETAGMIRSNKKWKNLPVIAVTAKAMTGDREKCIQAGASDYISKPVDIDQLFSLLRVWLYDKI